ncbi:MAG: mechanosensitive ion channel [Legionellaceae bacterium]|nr:mechanosensitive ion channel [Legionellaceae bacterium]
MKGLIKLLCYAFFLITAATITHAEVDLHHDFDVKQAIRKLDALQMRIDNDTIKYKQVDTLKETVITISKQAEHCIKINKKNLLQLDELSSSTDRSEKLSNEQKTTDFLTQEKIKTRETLSDCKLLLYEAHKLEKKIKHTADQTRISHTFVKTLPLWKVDNKQTLFTLPQYNLPKLYELVGVGLYISHAKLATLLMKLLCVLLIAHLVYRPVSKLLKRHKRTTPLTKPIIRYIPLMLTFWVIVKFLLFYSKNIYPPPVLVDITKNIRNSFGLLFFIDINYILFSYKKKKTIKHQAQKIRQSAIMLTLLLVLANIISLLSPAEVITAYNISGFLVVYFLLITTVFLWGLNASIELCLHYKLFSQLTSQLIRWISFLFFTSLAALAGIGYNIAAIFITDHIIRTVLLTFGYSEIIYFIWTYSRILNDKTHPLSLQFHQWVGLKPSKNFIEVTIIKFLLVLGFTRAFINFFLWLWDLPAYYLSNILDYLENDIYVFDIQMNLLGILRGLATFCTIIILGRMLGAFFARKNAAFEQKNARITFITLTNYIAFIIGVIAALLVIGINLSGFALVASALSVGIGFGLKGIAADLISGLILLLSKPLRPGDHIEIKEIEGFISKIRLLSTEIRTLAEANVILPNSALLSQSVTNYTYKNKLTRTTTHIMLKDIADVKRAKALMLKVAKNHPDIHQDEKNKPEVMVDLRPDKTAMHVVLTLWCIIKDADDRYGINSDINAKVLAAIEKAEIPLKL